MELRFFTIKPMLSEFLELLKPHLIAKEVIRGIQQEMESWKILPTVLREVLLNAMIHRKYSLKDTIKIAKFEDRLEIFIVFEFFCAAGL